MEPCKGLPLRQNPFQGCSLFIIGNPGLSLALQPWAEISERLRRTISGFIVTNENFCARLLITHLIKRSGPTCASTTKPTLDPQPSEERIRTMANHGSESRTLDANLKRRARKLATDSRVDPRTRSLIRYGLELKDQHLEQIVNRVEAGEMSIDHIDLDTD